MRAALCVLMCILHEFVAASAIPSPLGRSERSVGTPGPIDCKMSAWSEWSSCDPCTKAKYRSRSIEKFGQFAGKVCIEPIGNREPCNPTSECKKEAKAVCKNSEFICGSGMCINKRLVCNIDEDCDDGTDEMDCDRERSPCGNNFLPNSFMASESGKGINILGSGVRMSPFDNQKFNGHCSRIRDPNTLEFERLPWNVAVFNYESLVEEQTSREIYEDTHSLIRELTDESSFGLGVGMSFKFTPTESSNSSASGSIGGTVDTEKKEMIKTITEHTTTTRKSFVRMKGKVQLGTYRMRSGRVILSDIFLEDVAALPLEYEKGRYFRFLEDYGTHYSRNGRSGGEYELVYVLNSEEVKDRKVTEKMMEDCLKVGVTADFQLGGGIGGDAHVRPSQCKTLTDKGTVEDGRKPLIDKVISSVRGGKAEAAAAMKSQLSKDGLLDFNHYVEWARTINFLPTSVHTEPEAIYELIPLDSAGAQERRTNLKRGLDEYIAEYNVCKCQPCQNGGTVSQIDGKCICLCLQQFEGVACETLRAELQGIHSVQPLGNWACWSAWSGCSGGRRTRSRNCNVAGVANGICRGDQTSEDYC